MPPKDKREEREVRISRYKMMNWAFDFAEYCQSMLASGQGSVLCGFPAMKSFEVSDDFESGEKVIRYIPV